MREFGENRNGDLQREAESTKIKQRDRWEGNVTEGVG